MNVTDPWMSLRHASLTRDNGRWLLADLRSKNGVYVNGIRRELTVLQDNDLIEVGNTFLRLRQDVCVGPEEAAAFQRIPAISNVRFATLIPTLRQRLDDLERIARSSSSIVIHGPSGAGKEVVARRVHDVSGRTGSYVAVNCAALPKELVESELFGSSKGAFSGAANDRTGLIVASDGGTLFLDEIGDLPLPAQAVLLRVLEENKVRPVGSVRYVPVNLRVIAATHRDLRAMVRDGTFREDLLARLQGYVMELPSLDDRREDLGILIGDLLLRSFGPQAEHIRFDRFAARALMLHAWPHNVRELWRCLRSAVMLADGDMVRLRHLPSELHPDPTANEGRELSEIDQQRRLQLVEALRRTGGNISATARAMNSFRTQVQRWIRRYEIEAEEYLVKSDGRSARASDPGVS
ncbi:MAG TPA: sigma 54-interacting transcriptional regulator [Polyangiales bacterium]|nr:sigma 54-interacting transcriptional regulator [Polyangiales bacterium]